MAAVYTVVSEPLRSSFQDTSSLQKALEKGSDEDRIRVMKQVVSMTLAGDALPQLLMDVIRFVLPSRNKQLKKLLHAYWEVVPKHDAQGKLRQEMILVVNAIRNDLQHPNEYIRGGTLRFLTKFREPELLEPLVPTIRQCLENRHAYVRKNAVHAVTAIAQYEATAQLIPDAAELLYTYLSESETDATCVRNAFVGLARLDRASAYAYFHAQYANVTALDEIVQLAFIDFAAFDATRQPAMAESYIQFLRGSLLEDGVTGTSPAVAYQAATALARLSNDPAVLADAVAAYVDIAVRESDRNVKITALERVAALAGQDTDALSHLVMDVLLVLGTQDLGVRRAALSLALRLVTNRTVEDTLRLLKKELSNSFDQTYDSVDEYRHQLISTIRSLATTFRDAVPDVVSLLLEFLGDLNAESASEVLSFVKASVETQSLHRSEIVSRLVGVLSSIHSGRAYLSALWIVGEYAETNDEILKTWSAIRDALGEVPFENHETESSQASAEAAASAVASSHKPRVLADGTYATESPIAAAAAAAASKQRGDAQGLRYLLLQKADYFLAGALAATLAKLVIRYSLNKDHDKLRANKLKAEAMLITASLLRLSVNDDSFDRIYSCISILAEGNEEAQKQFLAQPHIAYRDLLRDIDVRKAQTSAQETEQNASRIEEPIRFRLFSKLDSASKQLVPKRKTPSPRTQSIATTTQLKQVKQLTGFSDPVYAEAVMNISEYDVILDVMLLNQTTETLQDLRVEMFATGELKVLDLPPAVNVAPLSFHTARITIRVSSADTVSIFGNISYEGKNPGLVVLSDLRLNMLDYIRPAEVSDAEFRRMWGEFEWENKVAISTKKYATLADFLDAFVKHTHMENLTVGAKEDSDKFLSAILYARSRFGEDCLANLSIERSDDGSISGHVRIRTEEKGPAVSLGDKVAVM